MLSTLTRLADGSIIVAGSGSDAWVAKMGPTGALDPAFGNAGIALPNAVGGGGDAVGVGDLLDEQGNFVQRRSDEGRCG